MKTAVILAAGLGSRFGEKTESIPKGFVEVAGKSMIERSIDTLIACGVERIVIGTGYKKEAYEALKVKYPMIETCFSSRYKETNSMFTLYTMRKSIGEDDFILLESDLIFNRQAILALQQYNKKDVMLISPVTKFQDQYYVEYNEDLILTNCSVNKEELDVKGEFIGIHKLSHEFFTKMCEDYERVLVEKPKLGYEYELLYMSQSISPLYVLLDKTVKWYEIDDISDLSYAEDNIVQYLE